MTVSSPETLPDQEINLRFKDIYESAEWKEIHPISRAQLLLVAEGVKPGTIIGGDFTHFPKILAKLGLESSLNTEEGRLRPVYMVAKKETLNEYHRGTIIFPDQKNLRDYSHHLFGKFLGYPTCCTNEYCNPQHKHESNFDFELKKEIESTGTYPEELDFCPPSFTPCGINCTCASPLLKKWKAVIEKADPVAAQELREFHWRSEPLMKKIHTEEIERKRNACKGKIGKIITPS